MSKRFIEDLTDSMMSSMADFGILNSLRQRQNREHQAVGLRILKLSPSKFGCVILSRTRTEPSLVIETIFETCGGDDKFKKEPTEEQNMTNMLRSFKQTTYERCIGFEKKHVLHRTY